MIYLHKEALQKISGAKQRRKLIPWLTGLQVPFIKDADGWPVVAESSLSAKLGEQIRNEPRLNLA